MHLVVSGKTECESGGFMDLCHELQTKTAMDGSKLLRVMNITLVHSASIGL